MPPIKPHLLGRIPRLPQNPFLSGLGGHRPEAFYREIARERPLMPDFPYNTPEQVKKAREEMGIPPVPYAGKDIGVKQTIPTGTLQELGVMHYGEPSLKHYRVTAGASNPTLAGVPVTPGTATGGIGLRVRVYGTMQNESLPPRTSYVNVGDARPLYVPGTSIRVTVTNDTIYDIDANVALDEVAPGFSDFWDFEAFSVWPMAGNVLAIPAYCRSFTIYTAPGGPAATLSAYSPGGILAYQTVLTIPSSGAIERVPGFFYHISAVPGLGVVTVYYYCAG